MRVSIRLAIAGSLVSLTVPGLLAATAGSAWACACCASAHTYSVSGKKWDGNIAEVLARVRFRGGQLVETGQGGAAAGLPVNGMALGSAAISLGVSGGSLILTHRGRYFLRQTDVTAVVKSDTPGVVLLKEYIFRGTILFKGRLAKNYGVLPVQGFIVLKELGNACTNPDAFKGWSIQFRAGNRTFRGGGALGSR